MLQLPLILLGCLAAAPGVFSARATVNYVIEIDAFLDKPSHDKWLKAAGTDVQVRKELRSTIVEMNVLWGAMAEHGLNVEVRLKDIVILNEAIIPLNKVNQTDGTIVASDALDAFDSWMAPKTEYTYDHAMFFIAYDLSSTTGGTGTIGYAYLNKMCAKRSLSVVEVTLDYRAALFGTHELGHSMGSQHDGESNACNPNDQYIMAPTVNPSSTNRWSWSSCSATQITQYVTGLTNNCLQTSTAPPTQDQRLGYVVDADEVCKRMTGMYLARLDYTTYGDKLCQQVSCLSSVDSNGYYYWKYNEATEGMPCGQDSRCFLGKCTSGYPELHQLDSTCPYGDSPELLNDANFHDCPGLASYAPNCQQSFFQKLCCESC